MPKKQKSSTCSAGWCQNHVFQLSPLSKGLYHKQIQKMRLCPIFNSNLNNFYKSVPVILRDNRYYTPTFILEAEKKIYDDNSQRFRIRHMEKAQEQEQGKCQMLVPKPSSNKNYCSVCQQQFADYLDHIESPKHRQKVRKDNFNHYIKQLSEKYRMEQRVSEKKNIAEGIFPDAETNLMAFYHEGQSSRTDLAGKTQFQSQFI